MQNFKLKNNLLTDIEIYQKHFKILICILHYNQCVVETQRNMERFYFGATLSRERVWLKNGNVELYSSKESLENGVMWKLTIALTSSLDVEGYVEKIEKPPSCPV